MLRKLKNFTTFRYRKQLIELLIFRKSTLMTIVTYRVLKLRID